MAVISQLIVSVESQHRVEVNRDIENTMASPSHSGIPEDIEVERKGKQTLDYEFVNRDNSLCH